MIDDEPTTMKIMHDLWNPAWQHSYLDGRDCDAEKVMSILGVDRGTSANASPSEYDVAAIEADRDVQSLAKIQRTKQSKFYFDIAGQR